MKNTNILVLALQRLGYNIILAKGAIFFTLALSFLSAPAFTQQQQQLRLTEAEAERRELEEEKKQEKITAYEEKYNLDFHEYFTFYSTRGEVPKRKLYGGKEKDVITGIGNLMELEEIEGLISIHEKYQISFKQIREELIKYFNHNPGMKYFIIGSGAYVIDTYYTEKKLGRNHGAIEDFMERLDSLYYGFYNDAGFSEIVRSSSQFQIGRINLNASEELLARKQMQDYNSALPYRVVPEIDFVDVISGYVRQNYARSVNELIKKEMIVSIIPGEKHSFKLYEPNYASLGDAYAQIFELGIDLSQYYQEMIKVMAETGTPYLSQVTKGISENKKSDPRKGLK